MTMSVQQIVAQSQTLMGHSLTVAGLLLYSDGVCRLCQSIDQDEPATCIYLGSQDLAKQLLQILSFNRGSTIYAFADPVLVNGLISPDAPPGYCAAIAPIEWIDRVDENSPASETSG